MVVVVVMYSLKPGNIQIVAHRLTNTIEHCHLNNISTIHKKHKEILTLSLDAGIRVGGDCGRQGGVEVAASLWVLPGPAGTPLGVTYVCVS